MRLSFCSCAFRYQHKLRCDLRLFSCRFRTKGAPSWIGLDGRATSQCKIVSAMAISTGTNPMQVQRTVIFVDRTNLFYRLHAANLVVGHLAAIFHSSRFSAVADRSSGFTFIPFKSISTAHSKDTLVSLRTMLELF